MIGREAPIAARRLSVAPGPEAGERENERGDAERPERDDVDDDAADEAEDGSRDRPAQETERHHDDEEKIGRPAGDEDRRDDHDLQERRDEDGREAAQPESPSRAAAPSGRGR